MAKTQGKVAKRYARALIQSYQVSELEEVRGALNSLGGSWKAHAELRDALLTPSTPLEEKMSVLRELSSKVRSGDATFANFLSLLAMNGRLVGLTEIAHAFSEMVDEIKKLLSLEVVSAFPLSNEERGSIKGAVERDFGSMATIAWNVDGELLGGLLVKAGDKLLDSSVRASLEKARVDFGLSA